MTAVMRLGISSLVLLLVAACAPRLEVGGSGRFEVITERGESRLTGLVRSEPGAIIVISRNRGREVLVRAVADHTGVLLIDQPFDEGGRQVFQVTATHGDASTTRDVRLMFRPGLARVRHSNDSRCVGTSFPCLLTVQSELDPFRHVRPSHEQDHLGLRIEGPAGMVLRYAGQEITVPSPAENELDEWGQVILPVSFEALAEGRDFNTLLNPVEREVWYVLRHGVETPEVEMPEVSVEYATESSTELVEGSLWVPARDVASALERHYRNMVTESAREASPSVTGDALIALGGDSLRRRGPGDFRFVDDSEIASVIYGEASKLSDVRWVALRHEQWRQLEGCRYQVYYELGGGPPLPTPAPGETHVPRKTLDLTVEVYDLVSGTRVARKRFGGPRPPCPPSLRTADDHFDDIEDYYNSKAASDWVRRRWEVLTAGP